MAGSPFARVPGDVVISAGLIPSGQRRRIQVTPGEIRYWQGRELAKTLTRPQDGGLCLAPSKRIDMRYTTKVTMPVLTVPGSCTLLDLSGFRESEVRRACESRGWTFNGDARLLAADARTFWRREEIGWAAFLVQVFGPFNADADETGTISLDAVVLEQQGDGLMRTKDPLHGLFVYEQAAAMQRGYAAYAASPQQGSARLAQAARIEAKGRDFLGPRDRAT
jgi:hypothetical protein